MLVKAVEILEIKKDNLKFSHSCYRKYPTQTIGWVVFSLTALPALSITPHVDCPTVKSR